VEDGFRIGDVVKLTSGGRHMTVLAIRERGDGIEFECVSFECQGMGGEAKTRDFFPPAAFDSIER
jgi:uncharacterized protein YodC (DUF2158 family)